MKGEAAALSVRAQRCESHYFSTTTRTVCTGSFRGVKRPGRGVDHPPLSNAEVKEGVELYLYSPSGSSWPVLGLTLPLPFSEGGQHPDYSV